MLQFRVRYCPDQSTDEEVMLCTDFVTIANVKVTESGINLWKSMVFMDVAGMKQFYLKVCT